MLRFLPGPTVGTRRNLQQRRSHVGALRVRTCCSLWHETGRPWHSPRNTGGSLLRNPGRLIFSLPLLSPDAVRPWTCVASSSERGSITEMLHRRKSIENFRIAGLKHDNLRQPGHALPTPCLDGGRADAPSRHSNASVRGRHRFQSEHGLASPAPEGAMAASSPESLQRGALRRHHRQSPAPLGTCPRSAAAR